MRRGAVIAVGASIAAAASGVGGLVITQRIALPFSRDGGRVVDVWVARAARPEVNEREIAQVLEQALDAVRANELRSESTADGVRVSIRLPPLARGEDELAAPAKIRDAAMTARPRLPSEASPPLTSPVEETDVVYVRAESAEVRERLAARPGVVRIEACGEPEPPSACVHLDLARLASFGLDLADVYASLREASGERSVVTAAPSGDLSALGKRPLRREPSPVRVEDVATLALLPSPLRCQARTPDGRGLLLYQVHVRRGAEHALDDVVPKSRLLHGKDALTVRTRFSPETEWEDRSKLLWALADKLRAVKGASLHALLVRRDRGEIVFEQSKPVRPEELDELRALVNDAPPASRDPMKPPRPVYEWAGVRGNVGRVRAVVAVVPAEDGAPEARADLEQVRGVRAVVADSSRADPVRQVVVDPARTSSLAVSPGALRWAADLAVSTEPFPVAPGIKVKIDEGNRTALASAIRGRPLATLVNVEEREEPPTIVRLNRQRAVVFELEVEDAAVVERVERVLAKRAGSVVRLID